MYEVLRLCFIVEPGENMNFTSQTFCFCEKRSNIRLNLKYNVPKNSSASPQMWPAPTSTSGSCWLLEAIPANPHEVDIQL